jgi:hypothetical protein
VIGEPFVRGMHTLHSEARARKDITVRHTENTAACTVFRLLDFIGRKGLDGNTSRTSITPARAHRCHVLLPLPRLLYYDNPSDRLTFQSETYRPRETLLILLLLPYRVREVVVWVWRWSGDRPRSRAFAPTHCLFSGKRVIVDPNYIRLGCDSKQGRQFSRTQLKYSMY